ncbi:DUF302 domain-containing protein [Gammaproteobacteria bacterium]
MYSFDTSISGTMEEALLLVRASLAKEGFGVLFDIDIQAVLKAKLGVDSRPYHILGACNPGYAHRALSADSNVGLLLPCNVVVREEENGRLTVAFMDPNAVLTLVENPEINPIARQVRASLEKVCDDLSSH